MRNHHGKWNHLVGAHTWLVSSVVARCFESTAEAGGDLTGGLGRLASQSCHASEGSARITRSVGESGGHRSQGTTQVSSRCATWLRRPFRCGRKVHEGEPSREVLGFWHKLYD